MSKTFTRLALGLGLATLLMLPLSLSHLGLVHVAHAQQLQTSDLLDTSFGDTAGLGQADLKTTIGNLIRVMLGFLGVVAVIIILLGGFKWMTAGGNDEKVQEAKNLIIAGIIGLAIILSAFAIASFVISSIIGATQ
ncbi:TPA: hypothetical protein DEP96_01200 [Candidatus Uhrbacteria bacterium]|nr:hypothetical protein [Candidatus Uhrbacteria bacterium]